jgi:hypothetical protein
METNNTNGFYIVRAMGKDLPYEIRHADSPDLVWTRVNSMEEGYERIKELKVEWKVDEAVTDFLIKLGKDLELDLDTLKNMVKRYI